MPTGDKQITVEQARVLQTILGQHTFHIIVQQPTQNGIPILDPDKFHHANNEQRKPLIPPSSTGATKMPAAGQTPAVPGEKKPSAEDWLAPIKKAMKDAHDNLGLMAEGMVRLIGAGKNCIDMTEQLRKALEYLADQEKKNEALDTKASKGMKVVRTAFDGVQKSALMASATLAGTYAALRHLSGAASPGILKALDGSMQLLTAELGSALLPVTMSVTDSIMDLVDWFAGMDDTTKKLIAGGALVIPALMGLGQAMITLGPIAKMARAGIVGIYDALGPLGMAFAGLAVVAGGAAAYNYYQSQGQPNPERHEQAGQRVTASELFNVLKLTIQDVSEEDVKRVMAETPEQLLDRAARLRKTAEGGSDNMVARILGSRGRKAELLESADILERLASIGGKGREEEDAEKRQSSLMRQARHYHAMLTEAQMTQKPSYSGLTDARKQLQLQILGKSPIEQQLLNIQRQNLPVIADRLDVIIRQLNEGNDRGRRPD